jgi:hypothetical protein
MLSYQLEAIHKETKEFNVQLELMSQECIYMKDRLTSLLNLFNASFIIEWAEYFQNQIIMKEEAIELLKFDLHHLEMLIINHNQVENINDTVLNLQIQVLEKISFLENDCMKMKQAFHEFIGTHLLQ